MKKFKYPLSIEGSKEQLEAIVPQLEKLGYSMFIRYGGRPYSWASEYPYLLATFGGQQDKIGFNQTPDHEIKIPASNPELVLALAACVDDSSPHFGEFFICTKTVLMDDGKLAYTEGKIYKSEQEDCITDEDGIIQHYWNIPLINRHFRKLSKEEILNHFNMKKIIGYKLKEDCKQFEKAAGSIAFPDNINKTFLNLDGCCFKSNSIVQEILKEVGVLDLWFEPVYEQQKETITLRSGWTSDSNFEIEVSKDGIYYAPDDVFLNVADLRKIVEPVRVSKKKGNSSAGEYTFKPSHIDSGCKKGVPVEDWIKVLNAYDEIKGK